MNSILNSVKKQLGITEDYTVFDVDVLIHINSALSVLTQLGIGPPEGFSIDDASATWELFVGDDPRLNMVKTYVGLKVRKLFDPPTSPAVSQAIGESIAELEWRLNVASND